MLVLVFFLRKLLCFNRWLDAAQGDGQTMRTLTLDGDPLETERSEMITPLQPVEEKLETPKLKTPTPEPVHEPELEPVAEPTPEPELIPEVEPEPEKIKKGGHSTYTTITTFSPVVIIDVLLSDITSFLNDNIYCDL